MKIKMNLVGVCFFFLAVQAQVRSQDLIVTREKKSINAKISKIDKGMLYYNTSKENGQRLSLPLDDIHYYENGYFSNVKKANDEKLSSKDTRPKWSFKVCGGASYILSRVSNRVPQELRNQIKELKSGMHLGFEIHHFFKKNIGIGLMYKEFNSSHYDRNVMIPLLEDNSTFYGIENNINISFVGPSLIYQFFSPTEKSILYSTISLGSLNFTNDELIGDLNFKGSQDTLGMDFGLGYDVFIDKNIALELGVNLLIGGFNELDIEVGGETESIDLPEREDLSRVELSLGLRWLL